jgi:hypothetical protein
MFYTVIILRYLKEFISQLAKLYYFGYSFFQEILNLGQAV